MAGCDAERFCKFFLQAVLACQGPLLIQLCQPSYWYWSKMPPLKHQYELVEKPYVGDLKTYGYLVALPSNSKQLDDTDFHPAQNSGAIAARSVRPTEFSSGLAEADPGLIPKKGAVHKMVHANPPLALSAEASWGRSGSPKRGSTLNPQPSTLDPRASTLNPQP